MEQGIVEGRQEEKTEVDAQTCVPVFTTGDLA